MNPNDKWSMSPKSYYDKSYDEADMDTTEQIEYLKDILLNQWANQTAQPDVATKRVDYKSIAEKVMRELERNGIETAIILRDTEVAEWWGAVKAEERRVEAERKRKEDEKRRKEEDKRKRDELLSRLTPEEKRLLGIKK